MRSTSGGGVILGATMRTTVPLRKGSWALAVLALALQLACQAAAPPSSARLSGRSPRTLRRFVTGDLGSRWEPKSRDELIELPNLILGT